MPTYRSKIASTAFMALARDASASSVIFAAFSRSVFQFSFPISIPISTHQHVYPGSLFLDDNSWCVCGKLHQRRISSRECFILFASASADGGSLDAASKLRHKLQPLFISLDVIRQPHHNEPASHTNSSTVPSCLIPRSQLNVRNSVKFAYLRRRYRRIPNWMSDVLDAAEKPYYRSGK